MLHSGDISANNGTGGRSIYGPSFPDEGFVRGHEGVGTVSMVNFGPNTNQSQFQISLMRSWKNPLSTDGSGEHHESRWMDNVALRAPHHNH